MTVDRQGFKDAVTACLAKDKGTVALQECIDGYFPDLDVFRENDDLVVSHGRRFLVIRRVGHDRFRTADYAGPPTTNEVDGGGGTEHDVEGLIDEIKAFSGV